jgi:CAAX protease family protein
MIAFAAPGERARATPVWAAYLMLWVFWLVANVAIMPVLLVVMLPALMAGEDLSAQMRGLIILLTLYLMFSVFAACALIWVKHFERRSLASAGLIWRGALKKYGRGLLWGAAYTLGLVLLGALLGMLGATPAEPLRHFSLALLANPTTLLVFAALIFALLIQSAAEEIICRGWLMSSIALRHGRIAGLLFSAIFFGSLHVHFLFSGNPLSGLLGIISVTLMGVMLGLYALNQGSIAGAAGMHGAFNVLIFGMALLMALATGKTPDAMAGLNFAYEQSTQPKPISLQSFAQGGLALVVSFYFWRRLRRKFSSDDKQ